MLSGLVRSICQVGVFMICAQAIVHFRPKASYEKYLKMLVSAMILIQLFMTIGGIFSEEGEKKLSERVEWFTNSLEESMQPAADNAFFLDEDLQFLITGEDPKQIEEKGEQEESLREITVQIAPISPIRVNEISGTTE